MKKLLLGTSALIGATAIVASASAAAPELTIGGNLDFRLVGGENQAHGLNVTGASVDADGNDVSASVGDTADVGGADRSWAYERANSVSEIKFRARGESDGGTTYGATIDYRYLANQTDESYIFIADDWGRIHLGDDDGIVDGYVPRADSIATGAYLFNDTTTYLTPRFVDTHDSTKIAYHSAVTSGFKFGISVAEETNTSSSVHTTHAYNGGATTAAPHAAVTDAAPLAANTDLVASDSRGVDYSEVIEVGVGYAGEVGSVSYSLGLAYQTADVAEGSTVTTATPDVAASIDDLAELNVGFSVSFGNFSIAASYADAGDSGVVTASGTGLDHTDAGNTDAENATQGELEGYLSEGREFYGVGVAYDLGGGMKVALNYGEATWGTYGGVYNDFVAGNMNAMPAVAETNGSFNSVEHTQTLTTIDFGFPIMDGMSGYAGVALSEYEQENTATGAAAHTTEATTYLVGTTVSF